MLFEPAKIFFADEIFLMIANFFTRAWRLHERIFFDRIRPRKKPRCHPPLEHQPSSEIYPAQRLHASSILFVAHVANRIAARISHERDDTREQRRDQHRSHRQAEIFSIKPKERELLRRVFCAKGQPRLDRQIYPIHRVHDQRADCAKQQRDQDDP